MSLKAAHLQALIARRREAEHNRIERTEAVNKYFDNWGKITARFENWTAPDYYKQAEQQLENSKRQKEKEKILAERQEKLAQLLEREKKDYEHEMQEKQCRKNSRRRLDTKTLKKIEENLKEQQQIRRMLELEAKLYGKWRHGVQDDNLIFESKSDNEVLAKLNWLDKQIDQQLQREKEEEASKERQLKLQLELNRSEELQKERQKIRENEIREIRCMQEHHLEMLKEKQTETDKLKDKENTLKEILSNLKKEIQLLEESYSVLNQNANFGDAYNFNKIKIYTRKRSEVFRNQINLYLSILERTLNFCKKSEVLNEFKKRLQDQLEREIEKLSQIEGMYESEAKYSLQHNEESWQQEHTERYQELKQILMEEYRLINNSLIETMKRHEELVEIRSTHLGIIENSGEKLNLLIQEETNSPRPQNSHDTHRETNNRHSQLEESDDTPLYTAATRYSYSKLKPATSLEPHIDFSSRRNCHESNGNNMSPRHSDIKRMSNSFKNLNLEDSQFNHDRFQPGFGKMNSQRSVQVVTAETGAERPRFGRKRVAWN